jgi:hypothetical protein
LFFLFFLLLLLLLLLLLFRGTAPGRGRGRMKKKEQTQIEPKPKETADDVVPLDNVEYTEEGKILSSSSFFLSSLSLSLSHILSHSCYFSL